ncbi:hypothetical protein LguiB_031998 [Lonicera macranthoides]
MGYQSASKVALVVKLKAFSKFEKTSEALSAATLLIDRKLSEGLHKFLRDHCNGETLAVVDSKLGNAIKEKLNRVRSQLTELVSGLGAQDLAPMSLGLSQSGYNDNLIYAIGLLDDLDKELNIYTMRVLEWHGWHFPQLAKTVQDNIPYAKTMKLLSDRTNAAKLD